MVNLFLAVSSALVLASAYLGFSTGPVSFAALVPFIHAVYSVSKRDSFRLGFLWGLAFFGPVVWWIAPTISTYGKLPLWAAWAVFALLACYLSLFPALWALLARHLVAGKSNLSLPGILALGSLWILLEALRGHLLSGFPWGSLAYSLCRVPPLIQTADLWGPYGVGFIIFFSNLVLWQIFLSFGDRAFFRQHRRQVCWSTAALFCLLLFMFFYGTQAISTVREAEVRVAAVQGSFDQSVKWDPQYRIATVERYRRLTVRAKSRFPDLRLVVWPETAMPFYFQEDSRLRTEVQALAGRLHISILFGSPSYYYDGTGRLRYRNSAFLVGPDGSFRGRYDKQHLVPFGEYMPWGRITSWAKDFFPVTGDFSAGTSEAPLKSQPFRLGVMICFESIFPEIARKEVLAGSNLLAVITNDAWFGRTAAPVQHADMALFRAVETRRWIIRAANTGVSRIISPCGQVIAGTDIFRACFITGLVGLDESRTFFVRYGPYWFFALNLLFILINYIKQKVTFQKARKMKT